MPFESFTDNSAVLPKHTDTAPTYRIVQAKKQRFVMILDMFSRIGAGVPSVMFDSMGVSIS